LVSVLIDESDFSDAYVFVYPYAWLRLPFSYVRTSYVVDPNEKAMNRPLTDGSDCGLVNKIMRCKKKKQQKNMSGILPVK